MNDDALDALLASSLREPADDGFSSHMMAEIADVRLQRARREAILSLLMLALVFAIAMLSPLGSVVTHAAEVIAATPAVWFALLMLALSGAVYGQVRT